VALGFDNKKDEPCFHAVWWRLSKYATLHSFLWLGYLFRSLDPKPPVCQPKYIADNVTVCLGLHLAIREIRLGAAHFFRAFPDARMSTKDSMSDMDMQQVCYFIMYPQGKRCLMESTPKA
jgi:hypothetical protein